MSRDTDHIATRPEIIAIVLPRLLPLRQDASGLDTVLQRVLAPPRPATPMVTAASTSGMASGA